MSEYIIGIEGTLHEDYIELAPKISGEIIRCRNCKHYDRMNDDEGMCMVPDDDGDYARWMVDPVGYCWHGERRDS